jgi:hypothetical protein
MALSVSHPSSTLESFSSSDDIGVSGWYGMWYGRSHIIFSISTKYVINILNNIGVFAIKCAKSSAHIIFVSFVKKESYRLNREKKIGDASQITTYL